MSGPVTTNSPLMRRKVRAVIGGPKLAAFALFFVSGHVPPLLRDFEQLFLDIGIASLLGEFLRFAGLGPVLVGLACRHQMPRRFTLLGAT